jgi:gamma-resorcylate decarboxylase
VQTIAAKTPRMNSEIFMANSPPWENSIPHILFPALHRPSNIWRISHWASPNGRHPQGVPIKKTFIDYFRKNFYVTTSGNFRTIAMRNAMEEMGVGRVLFSTDYPIEEMEEAATWFDAAEIGENDREAIGRDNAKGLFRLS